MLGVREHVTNEPRPQPLLSALLGTLRPYLSSTPLDIQFCGRKGLKSGIKLSIHTLHSLKSSLRRVATENRCQ